MKLYSKYLECFLSFPSASFNLAFTFRLSISELLHRSLWMVPCKEINYLNLLSQVYEILEAKVYTNKLHMGFSPI